MPDTASAINDIFAYWDYYIARWLDSDCPCCTYLPEPWWGWTPTCGADLHCVVINLNPGVGGEKQRRETMKSILGYKSYSTAMEDDSLAMHLSETENWHLTKRAEPILSRLEFASSIKIYLGIELSPLHSHSSAGVGDYVLDHHHEVKNYVLLFAALASGMIAETEPLHNKVIARCSPKLFYTLFEKEIQNKINNKEELAKSPRSFFLKSPFLENIEFICVSGAHNNLPKGDLDKIIEQSNITK